MAPPRAAAGVSIPADPAADSPEAESESKLRQGAADARWLETLSEPELVRKPHAPSLFWISDGSSSGPDQPATVDRE